MPYVRPGPMTFEKANVGVTEAIMPVRSPSFCVLVIFLPVRPGMSTTKLLFLIVLHIVTRTSAFSSPVPSEATKTSTVESANMRNLDAYLNRIGLPSDVNYTAGFATLAKIMEGQSRSIAFENFDVVMKQKISMETGDVEQKLVHESRGGYCFEQNTLLKMALEAVGFPSVVPLLCRVRWSKPDDSKEPNTGFTHLALKVTTKNGSQYLADVGFAGTNSMEPIDLGIGAEPQQLPEGKFRVVPSKHVGFFVLELLVKGDWRPLYEWRDERAPLVDQIASNWFSCTYPTARFTSQFFACRIIKDERHHILNDQYVIPKGHGVDKEVTTETVQEKARLLELISEVFGIKLLDASGIDRYLSQ